MVTRPLWSWYTRQVAEVKNQFHAIDYAISMASPLEEEGWSWMGEEHLCDLAKVVCSEEVSKFNYENDSLSALKIFDLVAELDKNQKGSRRKPAPLSKKEERTTKMAKTRCSVAQRFAEEPDDLQLIVTCKLPLQRKHLLLSPAQCLPISHSLLISLCWRAL